MASILLITASPYGSSSRGAQLAMQAVTNLQAQNPRLTLIERDLSALADATIHSGYSDALIGGHSHDAEVFALSEHLIRELEDAAYLIVATPMHNYTVPATLKMWIDFVLRYGRSFAPVDGIKTGLLKDRPTLVVVTAGGIVSGAGRLQPDHLTGYLADVLATVGVRDLKFVYLDGLVNPARAEQVAADGAQSIAMDPVFGAKVMA
ncbi:FMN-dependent NADH-azoreductase [Novosphingobium kaempferiae]|uniref:FMN-dependent NADH-azoreductase n=1 Tax=Novosphingobium kaempferiae TaxID=2896849 RepID=UPI001E333CE7|nr:NAD(P)H-dependent oxidoreductase [Novosphingobium kaempferiae]